ncbi:MAG: alcohol dehydrogenase catalytic domain-containing protein [Candidatus Bathyarchaeia archaeon]
MKAAVLSKPFRIEILDIPLPKVGDDDVLVEVVEAGVCGSDLHTYRGVHPFRKPPVVLGHEVAGRVYRLGAKVSGVEAGTRVAVEPQIACGECVYCNQGRYNICPRKIVPGVGGWEGAFAEYFVAPAERLMVLEDRVSYTSGVLAEPIAVGLHAARRAHVQERSTLILGLGPIGIGAAASARMLGSSLVVGTDIAEPNLRVAQLLGADATIDVRSQNLKQVAQELSHEGFDSVIVASSYPGAMTDALSLSRRGGTIVAVTLFEEEVRADLNQLVVQEREILGSSAYTKSDFKTVIDWLNNGRLKPESMVTHVMPLEEAPKALEILDKRTEPVIKIILKP